MGQTVSLDFFQAMLESNIEVIYPSKAEMVAAFRVIKNNPQRQTVLTEIVSAIMMEKNGIGAILTYDFWHNLLGTSISALLQQH